MAFVRVVTTFFFIALSYFFYSFAPIDTYVSSLFYSPHKGFFLKDNLLIKLLYMSAPLVFVIVGLFAVISSVKVYLTTKSFHSKYYKKYIYVVLVAVLGPGFIVHNVMKDTFNRARPFQVKEFGGIAEFTPAFVISNHCTKNCSFVSGHATAGFVLFAFAFLLKGTRRYWMFALSTCLGLLYGLGRIMQGKHFLSDVIISGIIVFIVAYVLDKIIKPLEDKKSSITLKKFTKDRK